MLEGGCKKVVQVPDTMTGFRLSSGILQPWNYICIGNALWNFWNPFIYGKALENLSSFYVIHGIVHEKRIHWNFWVGSGRRFRVCTQENRSWGQYRFVMCLWQFIPYLLYLSPGKVTCRRNSRSPLVLSDLEITHCFKVLLHIRLYLHRLQLCKTTAI